jgi:hypothetical protein
MEIRSAHLNQGELRPLSVALHGFDVLDQVGEVELGAPTRWDGGCEVMPGISKGSVSQLVTMDYEEEWS